MQAPWQPVLDFWFYPPDHPSHLQFRPEWFEKNPEFDAEIRERFGSLIQVALEQELDHWSADVEGELARIIVLDQFPRNVWRDTADAFKGDPLALRYALEMIATGRDKQLAPNQRKFLYMPLMHAEDLSLQEHCVELFELLARVDAAQEESLNYARAHRDIVARFGRFPHRNHLLGRESTPQEIEFLKTPGSSF